MTRRKGWIWDTWKREQSVELQTIFLVIKSARHATMQRSLLSLQLISYCGTRILNSSKGILLVSFGQSDTKKQSLSIKEIWRGVSGGDQKKGNGTDEAEIKKRRKRGSVKKRVAGQRADHKNQA
jgi:hypothetical protein